jgi:hypothetical protein
MSEEKEEDQVGPGYNLSGNGRKGGSCAMCHKHFEHRSSWRKHRREGRCVVETNRTMLLQTKQPTLEETWGLALKEGGRPVVVRVVRERPPMMLLQGPAPLPCPLTGDRLVFTVWRVDVGMPIAVVENDTARVIMQDKKYRCLRLQSGRIRSLTLSG